ncbi:hypothetical protein [Chryseobacterium sp. G0201]|uniref:hypothetical protein n=1 Tax=Chryseobacterium sp. G0201 TaxID=2487065 RepID=UPI000F4F1417|nr:hypothetical protein [Chryseobacterium sp. G0201]AZA53672.1 hypothetical protein EG348_11925 [Chryseobacterium sp. G0201]
MAKAEDFINMKIELIPVIEITNYDQDVPTPPSGPYWEFPDEWENYHISTNIKAGLSELLKSYSKASSFYRVNEISDADLLKIAKKEIDSQINKEEEIYQLYTSFYGGYILKIDDENKYFPQCCGKLGDIEAWEDLFDEDYSFFYMGHPSPKIEKSENKIIFDFLNSEIQENFAPPILEDRIEIDKDLLRIAVENAKTELNNFALQLIKINELENLQIPDIHKILIYGIEE